MKNWTVKEAVETIRAGKDVDGIKEIAKYFPMFFRAVCMNDIDALTAGMGSDKFTVRRVEQGYAALATEDVDTDDEENASGATEATEDAGDEDLSAMSTKELMKLCDKRGIKVPHYGKNKQFYLDALQNAGGDEAEAEDDAEEASDDPYEGKSAMELFKLAKKRGLKVEPKKKAAVYAEALRKADAEAEQAEDTAEDEDWGDEDDAEEEAPAPKKSASKGGKKTSAKSTKKAPAKKEEPAEEEDDGDDWDI